MNDRPRVLFWFLHLLGHGHVYRAQRLIAAMAREGIAVDVLYGGEDFGASFEADEVYYLPPVRAVSATYDAYLDGDGNPLGEAWLKKREDALLEAFSRIDPDLVLTEAYPFGRRMVRGEMNALLDAVSQRQNKPLVVSSVRDILQEKRKPGRNEEVCELVGTRFDKVLVHSDPQVIRLDETFSLAEAISDKLAYTGFVVPDAKDASTDSSIDILVSAGGGGFGGELMDIALSLANQRSEFTWTLTTGQSLDEGSFRKLRENAPPHVDVVRHLENLTAYMRNARVSISQCGYNTAMDVLAAHQTSPCRGVFVPYDTEGQTEQLRRAELLADRGYAVTLPHSKLSPEGLSRAMDQAMALPRVEHHINFDGATNSARLIRQWIDEKRAT